MWRNSEPVTILLVEPDRVLAQVLGKVLGRDGYAVLHAANAAAAIRNLDRPPALALLDFHLPDVNGVDLARLLRVRCPCLPMVLMTGCPSRFRERPDDTSNFRQVLQKPLELRHLREAVSAVLNEVDHAIDNAACAR